MLHLAIFTSGFIDKIFTGQKSIDARLSKIRCMPFGVIEKGDLVLMKKSGGPIVGYFVAGKVVFYQKLPPPRLEKIIHSCWQDLALSERFWKKKRKASYLTLIKITKPTKFRVPVAVRKRNLSGWITLGGTHQTQIQLF